ncbi:hypothetical protein ACQP00_23055 [Dactylosporangium sp. CS-047395]|uniref:hypothetical protein n=1 Tax=Dactylosporangium sp. CS-047395 TaxID=3239936 RepID=UPI003D90DDF9
MYSYAGPPDLLVAAPSRPAGAAIPDRAAFDAWIAGQTRDEPHTYVVDATGCLLLAPRHTEHVACAGRAPVRSAGEVTFARTAAGWQVAAISNQSTGYCPDATSWPAVAAALDRAGLPHPGRFTDELTFRRCPACTELNVVKDNDFTCTFCAEPLPRAHVVSARDPDFTLRVATFEELLALQREAERLRLSARWSSRAALERQVAPDTTVFLAPALRHTPDSYRCHIWFAPRATATATAAAAADAGTGTGTGTVALFDVSVASLHALREVAEPDKLRMVVHMLLDRMPLTPIE